MKKNRHVLSSRIFYALHIHSSEHKNFIKDKTYFL